MRKAIPLACALLVLALPAGAAAQIVPPGNSAAAQYTETIPTSQGEKNAQGPKKHTSPDQVIGSEKTKKLEAQGPEGAAVAEFTAETAPTTSSGGEESSGGGNSNTQNGGGQAGNGDANAQGNGKNGAGNPGGNGNGKPNGQGNGGNEESSEAGAGGAAAGGNGSGSGPSGSSAVGEVASQATGVSSGALGLWLPIVLVAIVAWAAFTLWRRREGPERAV